jgi:ribulose-phosphate 3-epimerase
MCYMLTLKIAPSVLAADFARLGEQLAECERAGADLIHFDVMDGHFVPNLSLGPAVLQAVRRSCNLRIDAHLMLAHADRYLEPFARAGADTIIVHVEANIHLHRVIEQIKQLGKRAGVALNPATPIMLLNEILPALDQVLVMTVNPGFGGQSFIHSMLNKISAVHQLIGEQPIELCVDGGIDATTAPLVAQHGANVLVAGTAVFGHPEGIATAIARLRASDG